MFGIINLIEEVAEWFTGPPEMDFLGKMWGLLPAVGAQSISYGQHSVVYRIKCDGYTFECASSLDNSVVITSLVGRTSFDRGYVPPLVGHAVARLDQQLDSVSVEIVQSGNRERIVASFREEFNTLTLETIKDGLITVGRMMGRMEDLIANHG